ncbi:NADH-ubiquinone oxidoreductase subunit, mitochondrial [Vanrija pseudolonga]|uniref:NADH-ubiquinone oxidoreductase subunit, mitochondrial n=1 Tax=Vanrija pseudolonga TaxID=143232 RepID=A0AAF0Y6H2_9TREE|nr:NADH-ubiquinone oxidoreductase subunit, mitochondrial [Vanrija pseudolonga]
MPEYHPSMDTYRQKIAARDEHVRESWIKAMEARIVRGELQKCYKYEGVNHYENCKELAEKYAHMIRDNAIKGYKTIDTE